MPSVAGLHAICLINHMTAVTLESYCVHDYHTIWNLKNYYVTINLLINGMDMLLQLTLLSLKLKCPNSLICSIKSVWVSKISYAHVRYSGCL